MWIISRTGFVSLVEHDTDPTMLRARARRSEHLTGTFNLALDDVVDLGPDCPDYRWHANVDRQAAANAIANAVMDVDYTSHVKEEVSGPDNTMYNAMLTCWSALRRMQDPVVKPEGDWWSGPSAWPDEDWADAYNDWKWQQDDEDIDPDDAEEDVDPPTRGDLDGIATRIGVLADKLRAQYDRPWQPGQPITQEPQS